MPWGRMKRDRMLRRGSLVREAFFFVCIYTGFVSMYQIEPKRAFGLGVSVHSEGLFWLEEMMDSFNWGFHPFLYVDSVPCATLLSCLISG